MWNYVTSKTLKIELSCRVDWSHWTATLKLCFFHDHYRIIYLSQSQLRDIFHLLVRFPNGHNGWCEVSFFGSSTWVLGLKDLGPPLLLSQTIIEMEWSSGTAMAPQVVALATLPPFSSGFFFFSCFSCFYFGGFYIGLNHYSSRYKPIVITDVSFLRIFSSFLCARYLLVTC